MQAFNELLHQHITDTSIVNARQKQLQDLEQTFNSVKNENIHILKLLNYHHRQAVVSQCVSLITRQYVKSHTEFKADQAYIWNSSLLLAITKLETTIADFWIGAQVD